MLLGGVRRNLLEARQALVESVDALGRGEVDPAYRSALRSRNLLFHAARGLAAARGEPLPEVPVTGAPDGTPDAHGPALAALDAALAVTDDAREMPAHLDNAKVPYARYLGWLREQVGKLLRPPG